MISQSSVQLPGEGVSSEGGQGGGRVLAVRGVLAVRVLAVRGGVSSMWGGQGGREGVSSEGGGKGGERVLAVRGGGQGGERGC